MYLGVEAPTDILVGVAVGVAFPCSAFACSPQARSSRSATGRAAAPTWTWAAPVGRRSARRCRISSAWWSRRSSRSGWPGRPGPRRCGSRSRATPTPGCSASCTPAATCAPTAGTSSAGLLYGRLEDEKPFNTVRRLVQQEDYALQKLYLAGLPAPQPYGVVELTPEREYLLVTEFFDGATELGEAEVDQQVIDDGLGIIRKLWDAGLAHRDIKPANLLVRDGRLLLIDVAFTELRPSPWRQAVDLANMMLCLALRSNLSRSTSGHCASSALRR